MRRLIWLVPLVVIAVTCSTLHAGAPTLMRGSVATPVRGVDAASIGTDAPSAMLMEVKASKQGVIAGESPDGRIPALMLRHLVTAPRDAATGLATGKRIHQPLVVSKAVDKSTPGLYAALTTNEMLPKVTIRWYRGSESYFVTELTNAVITSIEVQPGTPRGQVESVSFSYQQITWTSLPGNQQATDSAH